MGLLTKIREKPAAGAVAAGAMCLIAAAVLLRTYWPAKLAKFDQAFFTVDDGKTWYVDSMYLAPPLQHEGREAVIAQVYSYAGGSKQFCAYLSKFTPVGKERLEASIAAVKAAGKSPGAAPLYADRNFMNANVLVKKPGQTEWVPYNDPRATQVMSPVAPDGSEVDQVLIF